MHSCFSFVPGREAAFINPHNPQRRRGGASKQTGILINTSPSALPRFQTFINKFAPTRAFCFLLPSPLVTADNDNDGPVGGLQTASQSFWLHIFPMIFPERLPGGKCDMLVPCRSGGCACVCVCAFTDTQDHFHDV